MNFDNVHTRWLIWQRDLYFAIYSARSSVVRDESCNCESVRGLFRLVDNDIWSIDDFIGYNLRHTTTQPPDAPQQGGVEDIRSVGSHDNFNRAQRIETVQLIQ